MNRKFIKICYNLTDVWSGDIDTDIKEALEKYSDYEYEDIKMSINNGIIIYLLILKEREVREMSLSKEAITKEIFKTQWCNYCKYSKYS